ncbi:hypothetical protein [Nesterenkonia ebinurensis]|uniref:hypothetical protein n=1 Tax=Nesterenkonia ebinurensis TaxID=2608252 RepID=UPI00123D076A|nr:hypothetical protein [Nesterenkonia ebinurensis]
MFVHRTRVPVRLLAAAALGGLALTACADAADDQTPPYDPDSQDLLPTENAESPQNNAEPHWWIEEHSAEDLRFLVQYLDNPEGAEIGYNAALIEGELAVDEETGCIGIDPSIDGMEGEFTIAVFPEGTEFRDQDTLYVPAEGTGGELQIGDQVSFGGSNTSPERVAEIAEDELTCTGEHYWGVNPEL